MSNVMLAIQALFALFVGVAIPFVQPARARFRTKVAISRAFGAAHTCHGMH